MCVPGSSACPQCSRGFLGLVPNIRELVYLYAGVLTNSTVSLDKNHSNRSVRNPPRFCEVLGPRQDWTTALALLQTCHTVYAEVSALIYSTNRFITHDLRPLRNLMPTSIHSLSKLKIHVHTKVDIEYKGDRGVRCGNRCDSLYRDYGTGEPLNSSNAADVKILDTWAVTASHIGSRIQAGKLDLWLICDVENVETANLVVAPLTQWPRLSRCSIRLSSGRNSVLSDLARNTSRTLMGSPPDTTELRRYWELPFELRLRILQYTDLVTPWAEMRYNWPGLKRDTLLPGRDVHRWAPFWGKDRNREKVYYMFNHVWESQRRAWQLQPCSRMKFWHPGTGCFCSRYHAAYSPTCTGWEPPTNLFLVSKAFSREAAFTFLSSNHFYMSIGWQPYNHIRSAIMFLSSLASADTVKYLRSLSMDFFDPGCPGMEGVIKHMFGQWPQSPDFNAQLEWKQTTDLISSSSDLRFLEIEIQHIEAINELTDWWNLDSETLFWIARKIIGTRFWPFREEGGPPLGVRQLMASMHCVPRPNPGVWVWYNIRRKLENLPSAKLFWGSHGNYPYEWVEGRRITHCRSLEVVEGDETTTWIENIWLSGKYGDPDERNHVSPDLPDISL
ncbi:hypothetical protein NPX13_g4963 [Xylaria arbuscula]|uniref:Uncharacterized protein n=1 Tax=Xylaria arbuscula TaxID=114810 RepID=A0A9W8TNL3_9PEZI|nr:hypothetical protein NPX13_g4963 [Xylaria arbuscula]